MDLKLVLFAVIMTKASSHNSETDQAFYIPVLPMNGGKRTNSDNEYVTKEYFDTTVRQLLSNIKAALEDHERRSENRTSSLTGKIYATHEDIEDIVTKVLVNISSFILEHDHTRVPSPSPETEPKEVTKARDCQDIQDNGYSTTGPYTIYPNLGSIGILVRCDMDTSTSGWTVIQRRVSDSDFYKDWNAYRNGFGDINGNFWLGNENIHVLSNQGSYKLRVDLATADGDSGFAEYDSFSVGGAGSKYTLNAEGFSGNISDSLKPSNHMKFTTKDSDNDRDVLNCANHLTGAWWYYNCGSSSLNGDYGILNDNGPFWRHFKFNVLMKKTEMKIRRND